MTYQTRFFVCFCVFFFFSSFFRDKGDGADDDEDSSESDDVWMNDPPERGGGGGFVGGGAGGVGVEGTGGVKERSSWYRSQFKELENLGKGGFGTVVKVSEQIVRHTRVYASTPLLASACMCRIFPTTP